MNDGKTVGRVAFSRAAHPQYPKMTPYDPSEDYPEYEGQRGNSPPENEVYRVVRQALIRLEMDKKNIGSSKWNPFREIVREGGKVLIKPNLVSEPRQPDTNPDCLVTHGSVIRPVVDYALKAVGDEGVVVVADAPQFDSDFSRIVEANGLAKTLNCVSERMGREVHLIDLRAHRVETKDGIVARRIELPGDPLGYTTIDLAGQSMLNELGELSKRFRGSDYDRGETIANHTGGQHRYSIANTLLTSDCVISMPKMKTHKKGGVTLNLKNFVGINGYKNLIPHYRLGPISHGGDEILDSSLKTMVLASSYNIAMDTLPRLGSFGVHLMRSMKRLESLVHRRERIVRAGDWSGNDTIWRSILDLYRIAAFTSRDGTMQAIQSRALFSVLDGIIGGEGEGPLFPRMRSDGIVLSGNSLVCVDLAAIAYMGHDFNYFPTYRNLQPPITSCALGDQASRITVAGERILTLSEFAKQNTRPYELPRGWCHADQPMNHQVKDQNL